MFSYIVINITLYYSSLKYIFILLNYNINKMLHEISRKSINVNNVDKLMMSWHNSIITIRINRNLHMVELSYNLHSLEKKIDFKDSIVMCSTNSPIPSNYLEKYVSKGIKNSELLEMTTDPAFWPHSRLITQEMTDIIQFEWLPHTLLNHNDRLLSVVNSIGNVEIYVQKRLQWECKADLSSLMNNHLIEDDKKLPQNFEEMKKFVYKIETSAICWSPQTNLNNSCYFISAQKNGQLICWLLKHDKVFTIEYCGSIQHEQNVSITSITWVPLPSDKFLLISCNDLGQIIANECIIEENNLKNIQQCIMWSYMDKMVPTSFHYYLHDNKIIIICNKHRHLLIQMYDKNIKLLSQYIENVNDYKIICITHNNDVFYLCTENIKIYTVNISIKDSHVDISLEGLTIKDLYPEHELCSLAISKNKALFAFAMMDRKVQHRKLQLKIDIVLMSSEDEFDSHISKIMNNPTKSLTNIWDHLEVLRLKIIKAKKLPSIDYNNLFNEGQVDVYKLKLYYIFLIFYFNLEKLVVVHLKGTMPVTSVDKVKDQILMFQAVKLITNIYERYNVKEKLNDFDCECFLGSKKFLQYYSEKYSKSINNLVPQNILDIDISDHKYICQCCDDDIVFFSCKNDHVNMFCSVTFTPIEEEDYLACKVCGMTARFELHTQRPLCVFCDLHLSFSLLPK